LCHNGIVYDRTIDGKALTLQVSGLLWNRSLIMLDVQTKTEWSHLLGEAKAGPLKGKQLKALPADMVTWAVWKKQHPESTVLNMSRTNKGYNSEVYKRPERYVFGWVFAGEAHHVGYDTLARNGLMNLTTSNFSILINYDSPSTAARVYMRKIGDQVLTFEAIDADVMRDKQTKSTWDRRTGKAVSGKLKGKSLEHYPGIPSFKKAWAIFHPKSKAHQP